MDKKQWGRKRKREEVEQDEEDISQTSYKRRKLDNQFDENDEQKEEEKVSEAGKLNQDEVNHHTPPLNINESEEIKEQNQNTYTMRLRDRNFRWLSPTFQNEDRPSQPASELSENEIDLEWHQSEESKENVYVKRNESLLSDNDEANPVSVEEEPHNDHQSAEDEEYIENRRAEIQRENNQILNMIENSSDINTNSDI